ncbi:hypothetical protein [Arabidopsis thaliana]|uniref:Uncharacterized protein F16M22.7 n=1 Tax=Arabidopsis thaliana TaxID=3702 RepID=Q9C729_ARATH|nr:hypothetical protein [Arabidopsis thaliana]
MESDSVAGSASSSDAAASHLPSVSVLLDALEQSASTPRIANGLSQRLLRSLQFSNENKLSFKALNGACRVLRLACIQAKESRKSGCVSPLVESSDCGVIVDSPHKKSDSSHTEDCWFECVESCVGIFTEFFSSTNDAKVYVLRSSVCVDCLFELFWEKAVRNNVMKLIIDLMKIRPLCEEDKSAKLQVCSKYLETFTQVKERENDSVDLSVDLLAGMRDLIKSDSRFAFKALAGKGYQTLQSLLLDFFQWKPTQRLLDALLDMLVDGKFDDKGSALIKLTQTIGGHSISGKDIRKIFALLRSERVGNQQRYRSLLLACLLSMLNEKGPTGFFDMNGVESGIVIRTPVQWPANKGFSFCCWLRVESFPGDGKMGIFSFMSKNGKGCFAALGKDGLSYVIGPVYLFNDSLSSEQVQAIYSLGPSYMYAFLENEMTCPFSDNPFPSGILDGKDGLASKVSFGLNAQASDGRRLFNVSRVSDHLQERLAFEADIMVGTQLCSRRLLQQIIYCVGGISVFFPLITQSDRCESETLNEETSAMPTKERMTAEVIELIASVLDENPANQQQMHLLAGFPILGFLLQSIQPKQLNLETLSSLKHLFNVISSSGFAEQLVEDAISSIFLNPHIWLHAAYNVQRELYMQNISSGDVKALTAFFETCQDVACIEDVLHMVIRAISQTSVLVSFLEQVNLIGGCHIFVDLLQRDYEPIRLLSLQFLGRLLYDVPSERKGPKFFNLAVGRTKSLSQGHKKIGARTQPIFLAMSDRLFQYPQTDNLRATLFDVLLGGASPKQVLQKHNQVDKHRSKPSNSHFFLPQIFVFIFEFLSGCKDGLARMKIISDILDLLDSNPMNVEALMEFGWSAWLTASMKLDVIKDYRSELLNHDDLALNEQHFVRGLFCVVLCHYILSVKGGWQQLEETVNFILLQSEHNDVPYRSFLRDLYEDLIQRLVELSSEDNIFLSHPCRDNVLYLLRLVDEMLVREFGSRLLFPAISTDFSEDLLQLGNREDPTLGLDESFQRFLTEEISRYAVYKFHVTASLV